jgi:hypothetical protein
MPTHFHGILTKPLPSRVVSEKCEPVSVYCGAKKDEPTFAARSMNSHYADKDEAALAAMALVLNVSCLL